MNDVAVFVGPGDFFVAQFDLLKVVMFLERRILDVVHHWIHFHQFDVFQLRVEVLYFLTRVVDFVPLEFSRFQGLAGGHRLVQVRAGSVDFFGEQERRVDTGSGQLAGVIIGRDVQVMLLRHHLNAALTVLHVHGTFNVRATVVFQPQINRDCHAYFSISRVETSRTSCDACFAPGRRQASACGTRLISTRRLCERPSGVSFDAIGRLSP